MNNKTNIKIRMSLIAGLIAILAATFSVNTHADSNTHNPAFSFASSSCHTITTTASTANAYAEAKGLPQAGYRLAVSGTAWGASGAACGMYSGEAIASATASISVQSNNGYCSSAPMTASGTAILQSIVIPYYGAPPIYGPVINQDYLSVP